MIKSAITDIDVTDSITLITVNDLNCNGGLLTEIFKKIADHGINVDMITLAPHNKGKMNMSFTILSEYLGKAVAAMGEMRSRIPHFLCHISSSNAKITLSGSALSDDTGITADVLGVLASADITVKLISASVNEILLLVDESCVDTALSELNKKYLIK